LSSTSSSEFSQTSTVKTGRSSFPKRGKTRMPARMVSKRAIIELGYPFEEEVSVTSGEELGDVTNAWEGYHHHHPESPRPRTY
jgi:hypothetical protein